MHLVEVLQIILEIIVVVICAFAVVQFLRALTVKVVTDKWPHESDEAKRIFDSLP